MNLNNSKKLYYNDFYQKSNILKTAGRSAPGVLSRMQLRIVSRTLTGTQLRFLPEHNALILTRETFFSLSENCV